MTNKIDKEIGKQKFKAKRQYIVEVEFEGDAYTKEQEEKTKDEQQIEQLKKDIAENELISFWKDEIKINSYKK